MPGGPWLSGIGNELVVGAPAAPQIIIDTTVSLAVVLTGLNTAAPATDVTSVTNLRAVVRYPTNSAAEQVNAMSGSVIVTYTDASVATGFLVLGPLSRAFGSGQYVLELSDSSTGSHNAATFFGSYTLAGTQLAGTITLLSAQVMTSTGMLLFPSGGGVGARMAAAGGTLNPGPGGWQAIALQNAWTANTPAPRWQLRPSPFNALEVIGDISHAAIAGVSQFGTLPAAAFPASQQVRGLHLVTATAGWLTLGTWPPRLRLDTAGNLALVDLPAGTTKVQFHAIFSLDA